MTITEHDFLRFMMVAAHIHRKLTPEEKKKLDKIIDIKDDQKFVDEVLKMSDVYPKELYDYKKKYEDWK